MNIRIGDAFSDEMKAKVIDLIKADLGQIDLVVYSLAAPRRTHPKSGEVFNSTLKPIGQATTQKGGTLFRAKLNVAFHFGQMRLADHGAHDGIFIQRVSY